MLFGRTQETAHIERLLDEARQGRSQALIVRGEAGIGKSALLGHALTAADDFRQLRAIGIEAESELPYAHLHMLLHPVLHRIDALPKRQASALRGSLGLSDETSGDRFMIGLAVLTLLAEIADEGPVLCVVDDAHWIDRESADALLFAARRLEAEGVVVLFGARDQHAPAFPSHGIAELDLSNLDDEAAAQLLAEYASDLSEPARRQVIAEAVGNPLALRELPVAQREGQLTLDPYRVSALPTHSRIQRTFADRIATLPDSTRTLLLVAAAHGSCDAPPILAAATKLGSTMEDLELAERKQLLSMVDGHLCFRHPLVRSATYQEASTAERITVHTALAEAITSPAHAERRAWHLAAAATGPDEKIAAALEEVACAGQARGGRNAVASAYERSAQLSPDPDEKARRFQAAAAAALAAGQLDRADALAAEAASNTTDPKLLGRLAHINAHVAYGHGNTMASYHGWVSAAREVAPHANLQASYMLFHAVEAAWMAGNFAAVDEVAELATSMKLRNAPRVLAMARVAHGLGDRHGDVADGVAALRELIATTGRSHEPTLQDRATIAWWHLLLGDHTTALDLTASLVADCRATGAMGVLPRALALQAKAQLYSGHHRDAAASATEALRTAEESGNQPIMIGVPLSTLAYLAAIGGDEKRCLELLSKLPGADDGRGILLLDGALGVLDLTLGRNESTVDRLAELANRRNRMDMLPTVTDLVEAASRSGQPERAREPFGWFTAFAEHIDQPWAMALVERGRALLGPDAEAEQHFIRAVEFHNQPGDRPFERARTELLYGEWLRRSRRRSDARGHLRSALDTFERLGVTPWAERARTELRAAGDSQGPAALRPEALSQLTPQELQVVRLAATGMTNRDIGAQLFLSPRTVGYHLYKAYPKLNIASRGELATLDLQAA
ncbi:helix-turn-helix transcriptional regulator [Stackebrandtia nassauensis]|nr:helix-turn-helix transcriptional regulator [Stackebrandtia nassauensis]